MSAEIFEDVKINEKIKKDIEEPGKWKVIFLNDDKTPMEWVIEVLRTIFHHSQDTAEKLTLDVHSNGSAVIGIYSFEIAEQKVIEASNASRNNGFPLQIKMEKE